MKKLFFLIGSSGAGKTTAAKSIQAMNLKNFVMCYSDSLPVPPVEDMIKEFGSQEEWQRANTIKWVEKIKREYLSENDVLFDTQSRPAFIEEACAKNNIDSYKIVLFDCTDDERKKRLISRGQPELAHPDMMNWAKYLRDRCIGDKCVIVDNTNYEPIQGLNELLAIMDREATEMR